MSLTSCLKKAGTNLRPEDKAAILANARALRATGLSAKEAGVQAIKQSAQKVDDLISQLKATNIAQAQPERAQAATKTVADSESFDPQMQRAAAAKTDLQRKAGASRLRSYTYDKSPFLAFLGKYGVALSQKQDFTPNKNPMLSGYGPLFRNSGKSTDVLLQNAIEENFLPQGSNSAALDELITQQISGMAPGQTKRIEAIYSPDVADRVMNERMQEAQDTYAQELTSQQQASDNVGADPFGALTALDYTESDADTAGYNDADNAVQLEVNALLLTAEKLGIDTDEIKYQAHDETRTGTQQDYLAAAKAALQSAVATKQGSDGDSRQDAGQPGPAASQEVSPPAAAFEPAPKADGTLAVKGDAAAIRETLKDIPAKSMTAMKGGVLVGKTQADKAAAILNGETPKITAREAAEAGQAARTADKKAKASAARVKPASQGLSIGFIPGSAEAVTVKDGVVYVGKYPAQDYDTAGDVTVPNGATDEQIVQALRDAGAIAKRQRVFGLAKPEANNISPAQKDLAAAFTRRGDFWEYSGDQVRQIAKALEVVATTRNGSPMVGIPAHAKTGYAEQLQKAGISATFYDAPRAGLTAPTKADILDQQDRATAGDKANASQRKAEQENLRLADERKDIAKASEAAADRFELGGDAMQNLTGQGGLKFSRAEASLVGPMSPSPSKTPLYEAMRQLARFEDSFQTNTSKSKELTDIAAQIVKTEKGNKVRTFVADTGTALHQGNRKPTLTLSISMSNGDTVKLLDIFNADTDRPFVVIGNSDAGQNVNGATAYQIAFAWAHNNGKTMRPDPAGLTVINRLRRTEAMISSAMHYGTTKHLEPHQDQYVAMLERVKNGGKEPEDTHYSGRPDIYTELEALKKALWTSKSDDASIASNVQHLLESSTQLTYSREPATKNFEVVGGEFRVRSSRDGALSLANRDAAGQVDSKEILGVVLRPAASGVGPSTLRRAAVSGSVMRAYQQALQANNVGRQNSGDQQLDVAAIQAIRQTLGKLDLSAPEGLSGLFYSGGAATRTPSTVARVQAAITELIGGKQLPNQLGLVVVTTAAEIKSHWQPQLKQNVQLDSAGEAGQAQAFYDPRTKTVFLIADNIPAGDETAVAAHELMHKHGQAVLGEAGWNRLHSAINTWAKAEEGTPERDVYTYASNRVKAVGQELSSQELFPYAVEAAIKMGIKPSMAAKRGTVASWLESVRQNMAVVWGKVTGKPGAFKAQDLVDLSFAIAQMENPESATALKGALRKGLATELPDGSFAYGAPIAQTDTPAFNAWFKDSKVVDADGKPLVVYHGTTSDFSEFDPEIEPWHIKRDKGKHFFFGESAAAGYYAEGMGDAYTDGGANVMPVYLAFKNPHIIKVNGEPSSEWDRASGRFEREAPSGVDGYIVKGKEENGAPATMYVATKPTQIKSAIGNNGDFDPANPDIRYSKATPANTGGTGGVGGPTGNLFQPNIWSLPPDSKARTKIDRLIYEFQDNKVDLKRAQEAITKSGQVIEEKFDARLAETLYPGRVASRSDAFLNVDVKPLLAAMQRNNVAMDELADYLHARGAEERNVQIAKVNPSMPDGGAGTNTKGTLLTTQAARDYLKAVSPMRKMVLDAMAKRVDAITAGTRQLLVSEGLEKQSTVDAWTAAYKNYVPMFRDEAEQGGFPAHPQGAGFTVKGSATKRAMGSDKTVTNILAHVLMQREAAITRAEKNRVALALYGQALSHPNPDFWTTIKPGMDAAAIGAELQAMGVDPMTAQVGMQGAPTITTISPLTGKVVNSPNPAYKTMPGAITLKVNGEDRVLMLNVKDPRGERLAASLKNLDGLTQLDLAGSIVGKSTRWLASVNTQYNPAFGLVNLTRDVLGGVINLGSTELRGNALKVLVKTPVAILGIARELATGKQAGKWGKLYQQFVADGGQTGFKENFRDPNERAKAIDKEIKALGRSKLSPGRAAHAALDLLDGFNTTLENAVRLSAYSAALDKGMSRPQAARLGRELTVDFNRKGRAGRELGPLYAFFNASVQGSARTIVALKGPTGAKIIAGGLGLGFLQAMMLAAAGYDDDEIPEFVKTRALIIPLFGDKKEFVTIPYPLGLHVIPNTSRVLTELVLNGGKDIGKRSVAAISEIAAAFNPLGGGNIMTLDGALKTAAPTLVDPVIEALANKNFAGNSIEKQGYGKETDGRPGFARTKESTMRETTGQVYIGISKAFNWATGGTDYEAGMVSLTPEMYRYIAQTAGGGVLREIEKTINSSVKASRGEEVKKSQIPILGRFSGEVQDDDVQKSRYFATAKKLDTLESQFNLAKKSGNAEAVERMITEHPEIALIKAQNKVAASISKLNKLAVTVINDRETMKTVDEARVMNMRALNEAIAQQERAAGKPTPGEKLRELVKEKP